MTAGRTPVLTLLLAVGAIALGPAAPRAQDQMLGPVLDFAPPALSVEVPGRFLGNDGVFRPADGPAVVDMLPTPVPALPDALPRSALEAFERERAFWDLQSEIELPDPAPLLADPSALADIRWESVRQARTVALLAVVERSMAGDPGQLRYVSPKLFQPGFDSLGPALAVPEAFAPETVVHPIAVDVDPVVSNGHGDREWTVGALRLGTIPDELFPLLERTAPIRLRMSRDWTQIHHGDPVGPPPDDIDLGVGPETPALPAGTAGGLAQPADGTDPACGSGGDVARCYLPAVALHAGRTQHCSGTLLTPTAVLTAAHCFCTAAITQVTLGSRIDDAPVGGLRATVSIGDRIDFFSGDFCDAFRQDPNALATYARGDLAIVHLTAPLRAAAPLTAQIGSPAHLRSVSAIEAVGFGARETDAGGEKYVVTITIASHDCTGLVEVRSASDYYGCVEASDLVAIDGNGLKDTCHGDSGAGAYMRLRSGRIALLAVTSRGQNGACGPGGKYALVVTDAVTAWMRRVLPDVEFAAAGDGPAEDLIAISTVGGDDGQSIE